MALSQCGWTLTTCEEFGVISSFLGMWLSLQLYFQRHVPVLSARAGLYHCPTVFM